jgi:hypothetical protein
MEYNSRTPVRNWAMNFNIPFDKFPIAFNKACSNKLRAAKTDTLEVVRIIGEEINKISNRPGSANLAVIASAVVATFPASLADYANGPLIGDGSKSLHRRLIKYFENRSHVGNSLKRKLALEEDIESENTEVNDNSSEPVAKKSKKTKGNSKKDSYGCCNWQPVDLPEGEYWESQEEKREWLCLEFRKTDSDRQTARVKDYMKTTYISQRFYINENKPTMNLVREQWPFLLVADELLKHFEILMGFNLVTRIDSFLDNLGMVVYSCAMAKGSAQIKQLAVQLEAAAKHLQNVLPKIAGSLLLLPSLLKESEQFLFKNYDVSRLNVLHIATYCAQ